MTGFFGPPITFEDLNPAAAPKGNGPYHCHDCGASISAGQVTRTLIADWAFCADCWTMLLYMLAHSDAPASETE